MDEKVMTAEKILSLRKVSVLFSWLETKRLEDEREEEKAIAIEFKTIYHFCANMNDGKSMEKRM